ncbi:MAG: glycogen synthase [Verrucomicrobiota bacterium]|jgi:glycosyltransferase involved in cell wall biosynthesis
MGTIHFITNGVFSTGIAGGDIHFLKLAEGAARAGYQLNFFGGHALREVIEQHKLPGTVTLTDDSKMGKVNQGALGGQFAMFRDMYGRYRRTLRQRSVIRPEDYVYAVSDYWFDVIPAVRCAARRKLMVLHMEAPRLGQIITRSRPDVDPLRLASVHYWASQEWSLRRFAACEPIEKARRRLRAGTVSSPGGTKESVPAAPRIHLLYLHPLVERRLDALGLGAERRTLLSYGLEVAATDAVPVQQRLYDAVWIGRVHRQKGIEDLLDTLGHLADRVQDFKCIMIGNLKDSLGPLVAGRGLERHVEFSGFVSEEEKIRLFKASGVFLMPSRHEGSPRVIGESLIAGTPVVAYDIPNYRPLFGDFVRYAPAFDAAIFRRLAEEQVIQMRAGENYLDAMDLEAFREENSWETTQAKFIEALDRLK